MKRESERGAGRGGRRGEQQAGPRGVGLEAGPGGGGLATWRGPTPATGETRCGPAAGRRTRLNQRPSRPRAGGAGKGRGSVRLTLADAPPPPVSSARPPPPGPGPPAAAGGRATRFPPPGRVKTRERTALLTPRAGPQPTPGSARRWHAQALPQFLCHPGPSETRSNALEPRALGRRGAVGTSVRVRPWLARVLSGRPAAGCAVQCNKNEPPAGQI